MIRDGEVWRAGQTMGRGSGIVLGYADMLLEKY